MKSFSATLSILPTRVEFKEDSLVDLRCDDCGKLLLRHSKTPSKIEIVCRKCKTVNRFGIELL